LMRGLNRLEAAGKTAMYDAIVFSLLQFENQGGRRALVVLSDGDDIDSRFGPKQCIDMARDAGVPVYVIGLGALDTLRRSLPKRELRQITEETGGNLFFVDTFEQLADAYAQINAELRSQYSLGFYADDDLTDDDKREVEVRVRGGLDARTVVGVGAAVAPQ
ncbi:MAG: VWA domain-containing protein, partial [Acidobacteriota bacterium]